jgi:hypothetical protein
MVELYEPGAFEWWWEHTKSERAARLIERYWAPVDGNRSLVLMPEHKKPNGLSAAKGQVRHLKIPLERMGYRLFWRVRDAHIVAWVSPIHPNPVKPPAKRTKVDKPATLQSA